MELRARYQVMDQADPPMPIKVTMTLRENLLNFMVDGQAATPDQRDIKVTASGTTEADGAFTDDGVGGCATGPFGMASFKQELIIVLLNDMRRTVRTNNLSFTGKNGCGNINNGNGGDLNVTVNCQ